MWAQITAVGECWRPNEFVRHRIVWRGVQVLTGHATGLRFFEVVVGWRRCMVAYYRYDKVTAKYADTTRLQRYYDACRHVDARVFATPSAGLLEEIKRARSFDDNEMGLGR